MKKDNDKDYQEFIDKTPGFKDLILSGKTLKQLIKNVKHEKDPEAKIDDLEVCISYYDSYMKEYIEVFGEYYHGLCQDWRSVCNKWVERAQFYEKICYRLVDMLKQEQEDMDRVLLILATKAVESPDEVAEVANFLRTTGARITENKADETQ